MPTKQATEVKHNETIDILFTSLLCNLHNYVITN